MTDKQPSERAVSAASAIVNDDRGEDWATLIHQHFPAYDELLAASKEALHVLENTQVSDTRMPSGGGHAMLALRAALALAEREHAKQEKKKCKVSAAPACRESGPARRRRSRRGLRLT